MKPILHVLARIIGAAFMVAAFLQWLTFDYPDVNPFRPGAIFAPGMLSQVLNWLLVCVLAIVGWGLFTFGKFKLERSPNTSGSK